MTLLDLFPSTPRLLRCQKFVPGLFVFHGGGSGIDSGLFLLFAFATMASKFAMAMF